MKRVLLIENRPDYGNGGVEHYNREIIKILKNNFDNIDIEVCCLLDARKVDNKNDNNYVMTNDTKLITKNENNIIFKLFLGIHFINFRKLVYKLDSKNKYDLIIDSTITYFKKFKDDDRYLWVQHVNPEFYSFGFIKNPLMKFLFKVYSKLFGMKNPILNNKNMVLYDEFNLKEIVKERNDKFNYFLVSLGTKIPDKQELVLSNRNKIIYFGRIDDKQKNIKYILKLNKLLNGQIDFYGPGNNRLIKKLNSSYKGIISHDNLLKIVSKYKFSILCSKYEGFSYSLVQSLSFSVPIIVKDNYPSAIYLLDTDKNGLLLPKNSSVIEDAHAIESVLNDEKVYDNLCNNSYNYAKQNLDANLFEERWINIFKYYFDKGK